MTNSPDLSRLRIQRDDDPPPRGGAARWAVAGILLALLAAGAAWWVLANATVTVQVGTAGATGGGSASSAGITANGYVVARTRASVSAKILGRLATLAVHEGSAVRTGDVMATIDDADFRAQLDVARAAEASVAVQLAQARRDLARV